MVESTTAFSGALRSAAEYALTIFEEAASDLRDALPRVLAGSDFAGAYEHYVCARWVYAAGNANAESSTCTHDRIYSAYDLRGLVHLVVIEVYPYLRIHECRRASCAYGCCISERGGYDQ